MARATTMTAVQQAAALAKEDTKTLRKVAASKSKPTAQPDPNTELAEVKLPKGFKLPKTLAACADLLYELKAEKSAAQKVVDEIEAKQKALQNHLINTLPKSQATGVSGKVANAKIVTEEVPSVKDWDAFYAYIKKNNAFDLLNRAPNKKAITERWENKKAVPGVDKFTAVKVSLTKV